MKKTFNFFLLLFFVSYLPILGQEALTDKKANPIRFGAGVGAGLPELFNANIYLGNSKGELGLTYGIYPLVEYDEPAHSNFSIYYKRRLLRRNDLQIKPMFLQTGLSVYNNYGNSENHQTTFAFLKFGYDFDMENKIWFEISGGLLVQLFDRYYKIDRYTPEDASRLPFDISNFPVFPCIGTKIYFVL